MNQLRGERPQPRLLIAEDDERLRSTLSLEFGELDYEVQSIANAAAFDTLDIDCLEFAILDLRLGQDSGLDLLDQIKTRFPTCRIVVLTGYGSIPTAVEAIKRGAVQYLAKPARIEDIEKALWNQESAVDLEAPATTLAQAERDFIDSVLLQCSGNISQAAKRLGIHRQSLQRKLKKFS